MVKKRTVGTGKVKTTEAKAEVVTSDFEKKSPLKDLNVTRKTWLIALAVLVCLGAFAVYMSVRNGSDEVAVHQIPMGQAYINQKVSNLESNAPSSKASLQEKLNYYDNLMTLQAGKGDYSSATATYETRISLSTNGTTALTYYRAAQWYAQLKDKTNALKALDASQKALASEPESSSSNFQASIDSLRQEVSQ